MLSLSRGGAGHLDVNIGLTRLESRTTTGSVEQPQWRCCRSNRGYHRMPEGTVYMYHAKDRLIDVPKAESSEGSAEASTTH